MYLLFLNVGLYWVELIDLVKVESFIDTGNELELNAMT